MLDRLPKAPNTIFADKIWFEVVIVKTSLLKEISVTFPLIMVQLFANAFWYKKWSRAYRLMPKPPNGSFATAAFPLLAVNSNLVIGVGFSSETSAPSHCK
ncbi:hypothetical protein D3C85_1142160 [compost metagenome]